MFSARLEDKRIITTSEYDHASEIFCIDKNCDATVIFIAQTPDKAAHFKTTGKGSSVHHENCGYAVERDFKSKLELVSSYQKENIKQNVREFPVRLDFNKLDPDYVARNITRSESAEGNPAEELDKSNFKDLTPTPKTISSLKSIKRLFKTVEPDLLASIVINVKGVKIPLSEIICTPEAAHDMLWNDLDQKITYFVHGHITKIVNREKVKYITLQTEAVEHPMTLVIFDKYLKHFEHNDKDILFKDILACGYLKKNEFGNKQGTEMILKSSKYLEVL